MLNRAWWTTVLLSLAEWVRGSRQEVRTRVEAIGEEWTGLRL